MAKAVKKATVKKAPKKAPLKKVSVSDLETQPKEPMKIPSSVMIGADSYAIEFVALEEVDYQINPQEKFIKIKETLTPEIKQEVFIKAIFHLMVISAMPDNEFTERIVNNVMWANYFIFKQTLRS